MTPEEAVNLYVHEARWRFSYIPDLPDWDEWDTWQEFEARKGGDCDGFTLWANVMAIAVVPEINRYWLVWGEVPVQGKMFGHAWCEIRWPDGRRLWADPTWGLECAKPSAFVRAPFEAYPVLPSGLLGPATRYIVGG